MNYTCETCEKIVTVPVEGINVISDRGYLWCTLCADIIWVNGEAIIDFSSRGKMIPDTIITGE